MRTQCLFWLIAVLIGCSAGAAAVVFRVAISALQGWVYGTDDVLNLYSYAQSLPWFFVLLIPTFGGLLVGLILHFFTSDGRARSVGDAIEGAAMNEGRVEVREGIASAVASWITLSTGGSTGREGPVVHLAGVIATKISCFMRADAITGRDLLGCAVAAAVSASFNAPIAGALFALEVVLRHFAVHAFGPIVIASVVGTVIGRLAFGNVTEFTLITGTELAFYAELPAFLILGLLCGFVAVTLMQTIFFADDIANRIQEKTGLPRWLRPAASGALLGFIAIWFPNIIGVGYATTSAALTGNLAFGTIIIFSIVKCIAVSITMAGRMGGGIFSPALMMGALTGLAFGIIATMIFPSMSGGATLYALAGMGAVAAAVLGAPISTTLIVFELTGDWQTGLAVMVAVSMSTTLSSRMVDRSFFLTQLERRNIHLAAGPQAYLPALCSVVATMRVKDMDVGLNEDECWKMIQDGLYIDQNSTLEVAMPMFEHGDMSYLPVVTLGGEDQAPELLGALYHLDALRIYNRALAAIAAEEHS